MLDPKDIFSISLFLRVFFLDDEVDQTYSNVLKIEVSQTKLHCKMNVCVCIDLVS